MTHKHFLALATPGAGKSLMASVLAKQLRDQNKIDLILCFSPSTIVAYDFSQALEEQLGALFDGTLGAMGNTYTYQSLATLDESIWQLFDRYRVFTIFDEVHHCAGSSTQDSNTWGDPIITKIKEEAAYTLSLTGTPWRSDALPIVLADYCNSSGEIQCDYVYGLQEAIRDSVCRIPQIVALDNERINVVEGSDTQYFNGFSDLLAQSVIPYSHIVCNEEMILQLLRRANIKLNELRNENPNAAGLIVASSITHAKDIQHLLKETFGEKAIVVTSDQDDAKDQITSFRNAHNKWVISVGMISEGTNIPRLQVCCYLTNVKTEMYFRQVLGRILRITEQPNQEAYLYMPAAPKLIEYAHRIAHSIPDGLSKVKIENMDEGDRIDILLTAEAEHPTANEEDDHFGIPIVDFSANPAEVIASESVNKDDGFYTESNNSVMDFIGRFNHSELIIDGFKNFTISEQSINKLKQYSTEVF